MPRCALLIVPCLMTTACATVPDIAIAYYPSKVMTTLVVTQDIACSADGKNLTTTTAVVPTTLFTADTGPEMKREFRLRSIDASLADLDGTITLNSDGRLTGMNAITEGQAQSVLKSAVDVTTALKGAIASSRTAMGGRGSGTVPPPPKLCVQAKFIDPGKSVTVKYTRLLDPGIAQGPPQREQMHADANYQYIYDQLRGVPSFDTPQLSIDPGPSLDTIHALDSKLNALCARTGIVDGAICIRPTRNVHVQVTAGSNRWSQYVSMPFGEPVIAVPVPKSQLFGKQTTKLTLSDSGAVTSIGYAKTTGAAAMLAAAAAIITIGATR